MTSWSSVWPSGRTWVFQGTVTEDATAGTHISSLTVVPGAGNEMEVLYGNFTAGAGAANLATALIDDGSNNIAFLMNSLSLASGQIASFPYTGTQVADSRVNVISPIIISGTMRLIMRISTATVSLTHAFSVACRIKGGLPTATLADNVGTPVLTTNTNLVF